MDKIETNHGEYELSIKLIKPFNRFLQNIVDNNSEAYKSNLLQDTIEYQKSDVPAIATCIDTRVFGIFCDESQYYPTARLGAGAGITTDKKAIVSIDHYSSEDPHEGGCGARHAAEEFRKNNSDYQAFGDLLNIVEPDSIENAYNIDDRAQLTGSNSLSYIVSRYDQDTGIWYILDRNDLEDATNELSRGNYYFAGIYNAIGPREENLKKTQNAGHISFTLTAQSLAQLAPNSDVDRVGWMMEIKPYTFGKDIVAYVGNHVDPVHEQSFLYPAVQVQSGNFDPKLVTFNLQNDPDAELGLHSLVNGLATKHEPIADMLRTVPTYGLLFDKYVGTLDKVTKIELTKLNGRS